MTNEFMLFTFNSIKVINNFRHKMNSICLTCGEQCYRNACAFCYGQTQHRFYCAKHCVMLRHKDNDDEVHIACEKCAAKKIKRGFWVKN